MDAKDQLPEPDKNALREFIKFDGLEIVYDWSNNRSHKPIFEIITNPERHLYRAIRDISWPDRVHIQQQIPDRW